MTTTYLHGTDGKATHRISARRARRHRDGLVLHAVAADRWAIGDQVAVIDADGGTLRTEVAHVCVTTGQVLLRT